MQTSGPGPHLSEREPEQLTLASYAAQQIRTHRPRILCWAASPWFSAGEAIDFQAFHDDGRPRVFERRTEHIIWAPKYL